MGRGLIQVIFALFVGCILLALIGITLGVIQFISGVIFPSWLVATWIVINTGLVLFCLCILFPLSILQYSREKVAEGMSIIALGFLLVVVSIFCFNNGWEGVHSVTLFFVLIPLSLVVFIFLVEWEEKEKRGQETLSKSQIESQNTCSVCHNASLYSVCLDCERKHQREIQRVRSQKWRAKKAGEPATLTLAEWLTTLESFHYHCAYCQTGPYELMEHYIPIGQGKEQGGTTAMNCVPACFGCNAKKSNEHPERGKR